MMRIILFFSEGSKKILSGEWIHQFIQNMGSNLNVHAAAALANDGFHIPFKD